MQQAATNSNLLSNPNYLLAYSCENKALSIPIFFYRLKKWDLKSPPFK